MGPGSSHGCPPPHLLGVRANEEVWQKGRLSGRRGLGRVCPESWGPGPQYPGVRLP